MGTEAPARPGGYLASYRRLETSDLDCAREAVGRMWEYHRSSLLRGRSYSIAWHQADLVDATLSYVQTSSAIRIDCGPVSNAFRLTLHESGRINHWIDGRASASTPGRAVLHVPGQELRLETEPFRLLILSFPGDTVTAALQSRGAPWRPAAGWPGEIALDGAAGASLRALCRWAAREVDQPGAGALAAEGAKRALEQTLLMLFLECIDASPPIAARETPTEAHVRRLEEWMDVSVTEPVSVEDLARVAGVGVRSLQIACRRWRGCTPMELLRRRRLDAAGEALRRAEPGATVTAVATAFGFFNFGRFAALYRARFGETPSQTLAAPSRRKAAFAGSKTQATVPALEG